MAAVSDSCRTTASPTTRSSPSSRRTPTRSGWTMRSATPHSSDVDSARACSGRGCRGPSTVFPRRGPSSPHLTTATRRACECWRRSASSAARGSTSPTGTAACRPSSAAPSTSGLCWDEPAIESLLRLPPGPVDLNQFPTDATPGWDDGKSEGKKALTGLGDPLSDLQERLFAEGVADVGHGRAVLLVLQGMDTSGKGGVLRHTVGLVDPQGVRITSFKAPTAEESKHHFLWRIRNAVPPPGYVGVFDRSHYEDVLIVRVHDLVRPDTVDHRYDQINRLEAELAAEGVVILKDRKSVVQGKRGAVVVAC